MKTREEQIAVANEIIKQLGGHKFKVMTGARDILALDSGVRFKLPGSGGFTRKGINLVSIVLNSMDTYDVKFEKVRLNRKTWDCARTIIAEHTGIYGDMLQDIFKQETGLNTHL